MYVYVRATNPLTYYTLSKRKTWMGIHPTVYHQAPGGSLHFVVMQEYRKAFE